MIWHSADLSEIRAELACDLEQGLNTADAKKRLELYGKNQADSGRQVFFGELFVAHMKSIPVVILLLSAVVHLFMTLFLTDGSILTPVITLVLLTLNGLIGAYLESKADKSSGQMQHMTFPKARVWRDGRLRMISADELVPGDIIEVQEGDFIPADARLLESNELRCDEQRITGEAVVAIKEINDSLTDICPVGQRNNIIYATAQVTQGSAKAIVVETGAGCEYAKLERIGDLSDPSATPIRDRMQKIGKVLQYIVSGIAMLVFVLGIFLVRDTDMYINILNMFTTSVALTVAAVPYSLAVLVSVAYGYGILRILRKKAVIKKFGSLETLGTVSVICADKTGTLTRDHMEVKSVFDGQEISAPDQSSNNRVKSILMYGALCCDAGTEQIADDPNTDATELGIIDAAQKYCGVDKHTLENTCPRLGSIPFDGERKLMTTVNMIDGRPVVIVRGSTDMLLPLCDGLDQKTAEEVNHAMAQNALRVIAIGYKYLSEVPTVLQASELECGLTFLGMMGLRDRPRAQIDTTLNSCRTAGIRTVMITGEYITAAAAAAKQIGILGEDQYAVTGEDLQKLSDEQLLHAVERIAVYSRITSEDKIRIVRAWQKRGHVVALTGDGISDAESLRVADVGCAMGSSGSDIARESADVTLQDNNFNTLVTAIAYCRSIYDNIRRVIQYLLSVNLAELLTLLLVIVLFGDCPLDAVQLLLLTVLAKSIPTAALGTEPPAPDIMRRAPRDKEESFLSRRLVTQTFLHGIILAGAAVIAYTFGHARDAQQGATMAFGVLALGEVFSSVGLRSRNPIWKNHLLKNKGLLACCAFVTAIVCLILVVPFLRVACGLTQLWSYQWALMLVCSLLPLVIIEIGKIFSKKKARRVR